MQEHRSRHRDQGHRDLHRRYLVGIVGFSCIYAVCVSFFYSSWLIEQAEFAPTTFDNVLNPSILIAQLLGVGSSADFVRTTAVAFFLLYLILMVIWMVNSHERKRAESQARAADELLGRFAHEQENMLKLRCDALADDHGLTNREKDILYLLAQGRDLAFICEALFLAKNTVKSYQKSIYAKLGVHSKQEIIDLVHSGGDAPHA